MSVSTTNLPPSTGDKKDIPVTTPSGPPSGAPTTPAPMPIVASVPSLTDQISTTVTAGATTATQIISAPVTWFGNAQSMLQTPIDYIKGVFQHPVVGDSIKVVASGIIPVTGKRLFPAELATAFTTDFFLELFAVSIGFLVYLHLIAKIFNFDTVTTVSIRNLLNDFVRWGTVKTVIHIMTNNDGRPIPTSGTDFLNKFNAELFNELASWYAGLAIYHLGTAVIIDTSALSGTVRVVTDNVIKYSTVWSVQEIVRSAFNTSGAARFTQTWRLQALGFISGFVIYDILTSKY